MSKKSNEPSDAELPSSARAAPVVFEPRHDLFTNGILTGTLIGMSVVLSLVVLLSYMTRPTSISVADDSQSVRPTPQKVLRRNAAANAKPAASDDPADLATNESEMEPSGMDEAAVPIPEAASGNDNTKADARKAATKSSRTSKGATTTAKTKNAQASALPNLTAANFDRQALKSTRPVLVQFYADWCGPCRRLAPELEQLATEWRGKADFARVNVDNESGLAQRYGITALPTVLLFHHGEQVEKVVGLSPRARYDGLLKELH